MSVPEKNIVLVGFMASGKTFVSRELSRRLGRERVSSDELIVSREGLAIADIFAGKGEPYFRQVERQVIAGLSVRGGLVIDCGGGVAVDPDNMKALRQRGVLFYLEVSPQTVHRRTKGRSDRPLLNVEDPLQKIQQLLALRDPHYRQADFVVDSNEDNIGKVVDEILSILKRSSH
jgi:shikimate kinase